MRRIIVGIKPSANKTLNFNVYRSIVASELAGSATALLDLPPIAYVNEAEAEISAHEVKDMVVEMDITKSTSQLQAVPFTVRFRIMRDIAHSVIMRLMYYDNTAATYVIKFDGDGQVTQVLKNDAFVDVSTSVPKVDSNTVYMHNSTVLNLAKATINYFTEVIALEDTDEEQAGVEYLGPSLSYVKPVTLVHHLAYEALYDSTNIPTLKFCSTAPENDTVYYYRVVARDEYGNVSDPSNISQASVEQELLAVKSIIEAANFQTGIATDDQNWAQTNNEVVVNDPAWVQPYVGNAILDDAKKLHHQIKLPDVQTTFTHNITQTTVGIYLPNIWLNKTKYYAAKTKAFRLKTNSSMIDNYVGYSNVIGPLDLNIAIERLIVLRTEVDSLENLGLNISYQENIANGAIKCAEWVKAHGRYYDSSMSDSSLINNNVIRDKTITSIVDDSSFTSSNTLTVFDDDAVYGMKYRYDIYTWDDFNTESEMLSVYVHCVN